MSSGKRVLIVDDSATLRRQIAAVLRREALFEEILEAADGLAGFKLLSTSEPDLVLCDLVMPQFDGIKFLALRASRKELQEIPVIMLTAEDAGDRKAELLDRGASDYVTKPFHEKEFLARVRVHLRLKLLGDEIREANRKLEAMSITDPLTGLYNRRHLERQLTDESRRTLRYATPLSVLMIDIDHFKQVNDTHGHAAGDEVIRGLARVVRESIRNTDVAARFGGEEIAIVLPHTDLRGGVLLAERLRERFEAALHECDGATIRKTASFGVASAGPETGPITGEELLKRADAALYDAKRGGRNRVVAWNSSAVTLRPTSGAESGVAGV
jgi:diguanylate cyclase (GGDEF)-like protein